MKFVEFTINFTKLAEVRKNFAKFANSQTTLQSSWDSPITFGKSIRPPKNFMKFLDWKVGFKCLKVFSLFKFHSFKYFSW